jgi:hypothetical protein
MVREQSLAPPQSSGSKKKDCQGFALTIFFLLLAIGN